MRDQANNQMTRAMGISSASTIAGMFRAYGLPVPVWDLGLIHV